MNASRGFGCTHRQHHINKAFLLQRYVQKRLQHSFQRHLHCLHGRDVCNYRHRDSCYGCTHCQCCYRRSCHYELRARAAKRAEVAATAALRHVCSHDLQLQQPEQVCRESRYPQTGCPMHMCSLRTSHGTSSEGTRDTWCKCPPMIRSKHQRVVVNAQQCGCPSSTGRAQTVVAPSSQGWMLHVLAD
jgi:hypothetical protein